MAFKDEMRELYDRLKSKHGELEWIKPEKGKEITFRFLPFKKSDKGDPVHFKSLGGHFMAPTVGPRTCPRHMEDGDCPICDWVNKWRDDRETGDERRAAVARRLRTNSSFVANCIVYRGNGTFDKSVKLIRLTEPIVKDILANFVTEGWEDMLSPNKGNNITVIGESTGPKKMNVRYKVTISPKPVPVAANKDEYAEIMSGVKDLDKIFGKIPTADELNDALKDTLSDKTFVADCVADYQAMKDIWAKRKAQKSENVTRDSSLVADDDASF